MSHSDAATTEPHPRVAWVDYAKGLCILLVCMMHSTLGVGEAMHGEGFMHWVVAWARPFRMPDFFLLAGLFAAHAIDRPWRSFLDRKVVHFAYFYGLWIVIQSIARLGPTFVREPMAALEHFGHALVYPFPPLWFIYVLPIYFVATKLARGMPLWGLIGVAAALHTVPIRTGWPAIDVFAVHYYVYFLAGAALAPLVSRHAAAVTAHPLPALALLPLWALINALYAFTPSRFAGYPVLADLPGVSIVLGVIGAGAVVTTAALLARYRVATFVRYCGAHSLVIYVAFMLPMAAVRTALVKSGLFAGGGFVAIGIVSVLVIVAAVLTPLAIHRLVGRGRLRWLFERPAWFSIEPRASEARRPFATSSRHQEYAPMARRASIPVRLDKHAHAPLRAANLNVPFDVLGASIHPSGGDDRDRADVNYDPKRARHAGRLSLRISAVIGQIKDTVVGTPPVVEPPIIVGLAPSRLAQAIRKRT